MATLRTLSLSLIAALTLSACGSGQPPTQDADGAPAERAAEQVVNVYNWSDYVAEDTLANFRAATGIRAVYDVYDGNEILEAKLMARNSGYDVVFPSARPFAERHVAAGIYQPLDRSKLPNWQHLDPKVLEGLSSIDPGNRHLVPYMWGTTGLGINVAKVKEALGEEVALDSWALLFDPAHAGKLAACGIAVLDDDQEAFGAALIHLGRDPNAQAEDEREVVGDLYSKIRPHVRYFHSSKYIDDLANGDLCLAMGYSGDVFQARDRAAEAGNGVEIEYIIPKEGALRWVDVMAVPVDAPHPEQAHAFINYLLDPKVIASITDYVAYANPNLAARPLMDPEIAGDPGIYPPDEVMAKLVDPKTLPNEQQRERVRAWTSIKTGR
ncbi:polyamine ABC transporter substrate-binding protein [Pseudomarimonas salicorniae]|uniref:Putrescine-binding periplasmic protein n=1 Tax=Pseudomarimonas salicorniae TaxID=2933270 RepID=A0ABT0GH32_9GAMM|nr:polyamine ABC transporter substrate-binding protein [Lysobacter sp. CAU 1642]MCK7593842.1 polyamine ABC transporter substrate-binding protein [Lysobacter sp. CAU 1642]